MFARRHYTIPLPGRPPLLLGGRTLVMGIINVTPDSFADGGVRFDPERAIDGGLQMIEDGADLLDIGGESTRPGAEPLPAAERMRVHRTRRRNGLRCVRILLHETEIDALIEKGFLKQERRHHSDAVQDAIDGFICSALGDAA